MVDVPATRYAHSEQGNIAYQVVGDGPISVVFVGDWWNHVEWQWEERHHARFLEILASRTVVDLVAGSDIEFADRGMHALKGVPGEWQLFAVVS